MWKHFCLVFTFIEYINKCGKKRTCSVIFLSFVKYLRLLFTRLWFFKSIAFTAQDVEEHKADKFAYSRVDPAKTLAKLLVSLTGFSASNKKEKQI